MKDLPKVFANKISDNINNTQELFYGSDRTLIKKIDKKSIMSKINDIFKSPNHVYKSKVKITIKGIDSEKVIVGKNNTQLITIDGELIKIMDIDDIYKI